MVTVSFMAVSMVNMVVRCLMNQCVCIVWSVVAIKMSMVCLKSSLFSWNVMSWVNVVSSMGIQVVSIMSVVIVSIVVGVVNWSVVVKGLWVVPVDMESVPCVMSVFLNWLLNIESSVVVIVIIIVVVNSCEWNSVYCNTVVVAVVVGIVVSVHIGMMVNLVSGVIDDIIVCCWMDDWVEVFWMV